MRDLKKDTPMKTKKTKLVFLFIIALGLIIVALSTIQIIIISEISKKESSESYIEDTQEIIKAYTMAIENKVQEYVKQMSFYSNSDVAQTGNTEEIVNWLKEKASIRSSDFDYILYIAPDGTYYSDIGATGSSIGRPYFTAVMTQRLESYVGDPVFSRTTGKAVLHIAQGIEKNGQILGMFCGVVSIDTIVNIISDIHGNTGIMQ